jgi:hypothetical protein
MDKSKAVTQCIVDVSRCIVANRRDFEKTTCV